MEVPKIGTMKEQFFNIFDTETYYAFQNLVVSSGEGENLVPLKKYLIPVCGVLAGSAEEYSGHSYEVLADIDALRTHLKKALSNKAVPGQQTRKSGKPYKGIYYNNAYVRVADMKEVEKAQKTITDMGFQTSSNTEWLKQVKQQMRTIQFVLGGIGAVSLFVAASCILKILGYDLNDICRMFLMEEGFIGLFGGIAGLAYCGGNRVCRSDRYGRWVLPTMWVTPFMGAWYIVLGNSIVPYPVKSYFDF